MKYLFPPNFTPNIHIFKRLLGINKNKNTPAASSYTNIVIQRLSQLFINKNEDPLLTWVPESWEIEKRLTLINLLPESSVFKLILCLSPFIQSSSLDSEQKVST